MYLIEGVSTAFPSIRGRERIRPVKQKNKQTGRGGGSGLNANSSPFPNANGMLICPSPGKIALFPKNGGGEKRKFGKAWNAGGRDRGGKEDILKFQWQVRSGKTNAYALFVP
ncbi:hypothetical protein TNIN_242461 [Trichonephila inaurata madagascariensis]|uniref:Uncharacterized protein n=1 Tax=Trichonephila inaurata madagascariensis TaxID=2747483 RepID=A0A8X7CDV3_9ARAC|nr:hypothetical protein TNIN_242461 [Trichonephila inaurata madagascariensis]